MRPSLPPRFRPLLAVLLLLFAALACADDATPAPPTRTSPPPATINPNADLAEWTVMMYLDADDETLEQDILIDLNEAERVGSTANMNIVAQVDRFDGGYDGMGDWTSTKRFLVKKDNDLTKIRSDELDDLGEVAMGDSATLVEFINWAAATYPAQRYILIMSDHGAGWIGGWFDPAPGGRGNDDIYLADIFGDDGLWLMELDRALGEARTQTGFNNFEVIALDVCLMGQAEVYSMLANHANYGVASEEVVPSVGLAYTDWLSKLAKNPQMSGAEVARNMVTGFIDQDQTVTDDKMRAERLADYGESDVGARAYAEELGGDVTMSAIDLAAMGGVQRAINKLAAVMVTLEPKLVGKARSRAQSFEPVLGEENPSAFIDLLNFAEQLQKASGNDANVVDAVDELKRALSQAVIAEKHGESRPGSSGIAIHFPVAKQYKQGDNFGYKEVAGAFTQATDWDEFLASFYEGAEFKPGGEASRPIEITEIALSSDTASETEPVRFTSRVTGDRIAYIYYFLGRYLPDGNKMIIEDIDYIASDDTEEVEGVYFPVWPTDGVEMDEEWDATVFGIDDGKTVVHALIQPEAYGAQDESALYSVSGQYIFAKSNKEPRFAKLFFTDKGLDSVVVFSGDDSTGAPREIKPNVGDQFMVYETIIDLDTGEYFYQEGGTLTFGRKRLKYVHIPAESGDYSIGYFAEDLDGDLFESYGLVSVR